MNKKAWNIKMVMITNSKLLQIILEKQAFSRRSHCFTAYQSGLLEY